MNKIVKHFYDLFGAEPLLIKSPGRINLIGEHTDYNDGFVLPAAIDKYVYTAIAKNNTDEIRLYSVNYSEHFRTCIHTIQPQQISWANYILGVVDQLVKNGFSIGGFDLTISGDVPLGAGLSSSAAVECATVYALNELFELHIEKTDLVKIAQKAEQVFAGVNCGIMDQFASVFGKKDCALQLDCRSLSYKYIPMDLKGHVILLFNTNVQHNLASSEYNMRRSQCEQGVTIIREYMPHITSLRDVTMAELEKYVLPKDALIFRRCKHVITENIRLIESCTDLINGNLKILGKNMFDSHASLSKDYEVSCAELDFLAYGVRGEYGVLGARMMGGGFGGCTINIVKNEVANKIEEEAKRKYLKKFNKELTAYKVSIENGTEIATQLCLI